MSKISTAGDPRILHWRCGSIFENYKAKPILLLLCFRRRTTKRVFLFTLVLRQWTTLWDLYQVTQAISPRYMSHRGNELSPGGFVCWPLRTKHFPYSALFRSRVIRTFSTGVADPFLKTTKQSQFCCSCAFGDGLRSVYFCSPSSYGNGRLCGIFTR